MRLIGVADAVPGNVIAGWHPRNTCSICSKMAKPHVSDPKADSLERAVEVFVRGFGFTHPSRGAHVGPLWVLRDAPRKNAADYRQ